MDKSKSIIATFRQFFLVMCIDPLSLGFHKKVYTTRMFLIAFIRRYYTPCSSRLILLIIVQSFQLQQRSRMDFKFRKRIHPPAGIILLAATILSVCSVVASNRLYLSSKFNVKVKSFCYLSCIVG
jgi:hypothetical protein